MSAGRGRLDNSPQQSRTKEATTAHGATSREWGHFELILGLSGDMLPCVQADAVPAPNTTVKKFGKNPSFYVNTDSNQAVGIKGWQSKELDGSEITKWSNDPRHNICIRTSAVRAIDVDVLDSELALQIRLFIQESLGLLPTRARSNAPKFLCAFSCLDPLQKRIINTKAGRIELLGDGQQFVAAGMHLSGVRYEWKDGLPESIPTFSLEAINDVWQQLVEKFGVEPLRQQVERDVNTGEAGDFVQLSSATPWQLIELKSALVWPALLKAAGDEDFCSNKIGYPLLSLGDVGRALWYEFCPKADDTSDNPNPNWHKEWWTKHRSGGSKTDFRSIFKEARKLGWEPPPPPPPETDDYEVMEPVIPVAVGEVPQAHSLCSDLKNAGRLRDAFGAKHLIAVGGKFLNWDGTHWQLDENAAHRCAARLPEIVRAEAQAAAKHYEKLAKKDSDSASLLKTTGRPDQSAKVQALITTPDGAKLYQAQERVEVLNKHAARCEMLKVRTDALNDLRKMCTVERDQLDANRDVVTCKNGTLNLNTGELSDNSPDNFITKLCPVNYNPNAQAPRFEKFLREILDDEANISFLQRWLGYGLTGHEREQVLLIATGEGSNGKGTLVRVIKEIFGAHHVTAPATLLTAQNANVERHPTELAHIDGRRLVTVPEVDRNVSIREALIKQLTGEDGVAARKMREDYYNFERLPKFQILCNTKPRITGTEFGTWRRILVLDFPHKFGTDVQIKAGEVDKLIDNTLTEVLRTELEGIFAWLVRGAMEWYRIGLQPTKQVLLAAKSYQQSQDKTHQFLNDCCELDPNNWTAFAEIYAEYCQWCRDSGYQPVNKSRFSTELLNRPGFKNKPGSSGANRNVAGCYGLRLLDELLK